MNDLERWIHLQGPAPKGVRELFDAARRPQAMTPELEAELDHRVFAAVAEERRLRERRRTRRVAAGVALLAACIAGCVAMVMVLAPQAFAPPRFARDLSMRLDLAPARFGAPIPSATPSPAPSPADAVTPVTPVTPPAPKTGPKRRL